MIARNTLFALLFLLATFGLWVASSIAVFSYLISPGDSFRMHFGFSFPDILHVLPFLVGAGLVGWFSSFAFRGSTVRIFLSATLLIIALMYLYTSGAFIPSNALTFHWGAVAFLTLLIPTIGWTVSAFRRRFQT